MVDFTRRDFLTYAGAAASVHALGSPQIATAATSAPRFVLPALPYADTDLAPVISQHTIGFHYGKHHAGYVANLNNLLAQSTYSKYADKTLEQIIQASANRSKLVSLFNNAAQAFNHEFYWNSLRPAGGDAAPPTGILLDKLNSAFGDYATFKIQFRDAAVAQFGNGWAWLAEDHGQLKIVTTANANNPLTRGLKPLLTIDVWEHAYYLDYQNLRKTHVDAVIAKLLNWDKAADRLGGA